MRAAVAALVVAGALAGCAGPSPAARVAVATPAPVVERVLLTGALHPVGEVKLVVPETDQSTLAIRWLVDNGTVVHAGDRVAELDPTALAGPVSDLRLALAGAELQLRNQDHVDATQTKSKRNDVRRAQIEHDKAALHAAIPADLQDAHTAHDAALRLAHATTALRAAEADLASTTAQIAIKRELAELEIERQHRAIAVGEQQIASLVLRAPRDGVAVVGDMPWAGRALRVGDAVSTQTAVVTMPDLAAAMQVFARSSDVDDGRVAPGMTGTCTLDAYPTEPIACAVEVVSPVARPEPGNSGLRRSFDVTLALTWIAPARLRAGMSFEVELHRPAVVGVAVPRGAIVHDLFGARVALASGEPRYVEVGACDAQRCTVASGLVAGDVVRLAPAGGAS